MEKADKQKIIKHAIIVIILCIPMAFLWYVIINANSTPSYKTETVTATEPRVYVTTYGDRYHSAGCSYLAKSQHAMGKQEAISKGYTACSRCGGRASGTISVTYTKKIEVDGTAKNIWGAIGLSVLCTPLAYLFIYCLISEHIESKGYKPVAQSSSSRSSATSNTTPTAPITPPPPKLSIRVGDAVKHKTFGLGVVKKFDGRYLTVSFDKDTKDFVFPDVFDSGIMTKFAKKEEKQNV